MYHKPERVLCLDMTSFAVRTVYFQVPRHTFCDGSLPLEIAKYYNDVRFMFFS